MLHSLVTKCACWEKRERLIAGHAGNAARAAAPADVARDSSRSNGGSTSKSTYARGGSSPPAVLARRSALTRPCVGGAGGALRLASAPRREPLKRGQLKRGQLKRGQLKRGGLWCSHARECRTAARLSGGSSNHHCHGCKSRVIIGTAPEAARLAGSAG